MKITDMKATIITGFFRSREILINLSNETGLQDSEIMKIITAKNSTEEQIKYLYDKYLEVAANVNENIKINILTK